MHIIHHVTVKCSLHPTDADLMAVHHLFKRGILEHSGLKDGSITDTISVHRLEIHDSSMVSIRNPMPAAMYPLSEVTTMKVSNAINAILADPDLRADYDSMATIVSYVVTSSNVAIKVANLENDFIVKKPSGLEQS